MAALRLEKPMAEEYLQKIDPVLWSMAFFPENPGRFGHDTSNIVELVNKSLKIDCQLSIVELLNSICHSQMALRFTCLQEANKYQPRFTKLCLSGLELQYMGQRKYYTTTSPTIGRIQQPNGRVHIVNLETKSCGCRRFQQNGIPCGHAIACIALLRQPLLDFCPLALATSTWQDTYATHFMPVDITNLIPGDVFPPTTRVKRRRPKKERIQPNKARRHARIQQIAGGVPYIPDHAPHYCSTCGQEGHNARSCKKPYN